jgi:hypothetical protein
MAQRELDYYDLNDAGKELWNEFNNIATGVYSRNRDHKEVLDEIRAKS